MKMSFISDRDTIFKQMKYSNADKNFADFAEFYWVNYKAIEFLYYPLKAENTIPGFYKPFEGKDREMAKLLFLGMWETMGLRI
jgi:hypothetical protein